MKIYLPISKAHCTLHVFCNSFRVFRVIILYLPCLQIFCTAKDKYVLKMTKKPESPQTSLKPVTHFLFLAWVLGFPGFGVLFNMLILIEKFSATKVSKKMTPKPESPKTHVKTV